MTHENFKAAIGQQLGRCMDLLVLKGSEYAPGADRLAAFRAAAGLQNCSMAEAAYGMLAKHLVSVADMAKIPGAYSTERWDEKLTDSINYLLILRAILEEERPEADAHEEANNE